MARTRPGRSALFPQLLAHPRATPGDEATATLRDLWALLLYRRQSARAQTTRAQTALPKARHVPLDAGHVPFHDAPDAVADVIRSTAKA